MSAMYNSIYSSQCMDSRFIKAQFYVTMCSLLHFFIFYLMLVVTIKDPLKWYAMGRVYLCHISHGLFLYKIKWSIFFSAYFEVFTTQYHWTQSGVSEAFANKLVMVLLSGLFAHNVQYYAFYSRYNTFYSTSYSPVATVYTRDSMCLVNHKHPWHVAGILRVQKAPQYCV